MMLLKLHFYEKFAVEFQNCEKKRKNSKLKVLLPHPVLYISNNTHYTHVAGSLSSNSTKKGNLITQGRSEQSIFENT